MRHGRFGVGALSGLRLAARGLVFCLVVLGLAASACLAGQAVLEPSPPGPQASAILTVSMSGFSSDAGSVMISLFASPEGFPFDTAKAARTAKAEIRGGKAIAVFPGLPYGTYALAMFHDNDGTGKLPRNFLGIPQKGYGLSNNPSGLASFDKSRFKLETPEKGIDITVKY